MSIVRNFNLYLNAGNGSAPYINVNQYDQGEQWVFTLYKEDGTKYTPSTGAIVGIKADNRGIINTGTVDADGRVVINETQQMTAAAGIAIFELLIDGDSHGTANFLVNVEQRPGDNADLSDSDLSLIQQAVDSAKVIVEVIGDGDPSEVIGEHVDEWLDNHPEATTTVEDGAITAPKINNSLWDKLLVSEEASGNPASFEDGADDVPVSSLKVALEPIQLGSGDPSPSNVRPIIAANGKNLANFVNGYGIDTSGQVVAYGTRIATVNPITIKSGVSYKVIYSGNATGAIYAVFNGSTLVRRNFGLASGAVLDTSGGTDLYVCVYAGESTTVTVDSSHSMVIDSSITDFTYQPYQGITVERTGKNLLPMTLSTLKASNTRGTWSGNTYTDSSAVTFRIDTDNNGNVTQIVANGTGASAAVLFLNQSYEITDGKEYILNGTPSGGGNSTYRMECYFRNANNVLNGAKYETGSGLVFKMTDYAGTVRINTFIISIQSGVTCNNLVFKPMIRLSSVTDSTYVPYQSASYPISLGRDVYGGTLDVITGVLTVDKAYVVFDGSSDEGWAYNNTLFYCPLTGGIITDDTTQYNEYVVSNAYKSASWARRADKTVSMWYGSSRLALWDSTYTSLDAFKTYLASHNVEIVYQLQTPQTIQLTPTEVKTLLGYNNISSSGTVDVIYHADTKLYVDKMTNVDNNIIAPTEADFVATRNYTTNDLVIVNDTLYKVTANIASGSAITPNSNVQQTTLSALIKALS